MRRFILAGSALALLLAVPIAARAQQTRVITGTVTIAGSSQPLADASVSVVGTAAVTRAGTDGQYRLDFNRARNPFCAYSSAYPCPAPWRGNVIPARIAAGERYSGGGLAAPAAGEEVQ